MPSLPPLVAIEPLSYGMSPRARLFDDLLVIPVE